MPPKFGQHFGPLWIIAMQQVILEYINFLRLEQGHPAITWTEFQALSLNHLSYMNVDDWLDSDLPA